MISKIILLALVVVIVLSVEAAQSFDKIYKVSSLPDCPQIPPVSYLRVFKVDSYEALDVKIDKAIREEDFEYIQWIHSFGELEKRLNPEHFFILAKSRSENSFDILNFLLLRKITNDIDLSNHLEKLLLPTIPDQIEKFKLFLKFFKVRDIVTLSTIIYMIASHGSQEFLDHLLKTHLDIDMFMAALDVAYEVSELEINNVATRFILKNILN